jgi:hypothetical protein
MGFRCVALSGGTRVYRIVTQYCVDEIIMVLRNFPTELDICNRSEPRTDNRRPCTL